MGSSALTGEQITLLVVGVIGTHWIFNNYLEDFLMKHRYFRCRRWFQKARLLPYKKPSIAISHTKVIHTSNGGVSVTPKIKNFPDGSLAKVFYVIGDNQQRVGPYCASPHELAIVNTQEPTRVVAIAEDPFGYKAQCVFAILAAPKIREIKNHTRTSMFTATVQMVECTDFQSRTVHVSYYDGNRSLGTFTLAGEHKLVNLQETTNEIKACATDEFGNTAETTFDIDHNIPSLSYDGVSRKPTSTNVIGVKLNNFPDKESAVVSYCWHPEHQVLNSSTEHIILPEFSHNGGGGRIVATATDCGNEYKAECQIKIGPSPCVEPITEHTRTSVSTATIHQVQCKNFATISTVCITYYDGETPLGKFKVGEVHELMNLKESSRKIKAQATDEFGNSAETYFTLKLPTNDACIETDNDEVDANNPTQTTTNEKTAQSNDQEQINKKQKSAGKKSNPTGMTTYKIVVKTSGTYQAGTNANVFIKMFGEKTAAEFQLKKSRTHLDKFEKNNADIFVISTMSLGDLHKIKIWHDDSAIQSGWHLEYVRIVDEDTRKSYKFPCNQWLARDEGNKQISRELKATPISYGLIDENQNPRTYPETSYEITVKTTDKVKAGTNAHVFIQMIGENGNKSEELQLKESATHKGKIFEKDYVDIFSFKNMTSLGNLTKIRIYHDNSAFWASGWHLEYVEIVDEACGKSYSFPCHKWLAKDEGDRKIERELAVQATEELVKASRTEIEQDNVAEENEQPGMTSYRIVVKTSDKHQAGTDANVFIKMFGDNSTKELHLEDSRTHLDKFEKNNADIFLTRTMSLGDLHKIRVWHDDSALQSGWHLEYVRIVDENTRKSYKFPCNQWLARDEGDKQISRELEPTVINEQENGTNTETPYEITVKTTNKLKAGTDARVFIQMFGENGETSDELQLTDSATHKGKIFEKDYVDIFSFKMASLGNLSKVRIRHDNSALHSGWHLEYVEIVDEISGKSFKFPCSRWLAKDEDDNEIQRELPCTK
ncbi:lipoxygenase homology domain-containing protein 1-like [Amphiura filiformis]|uniref:lipoxygenase homology domain-containing protein 1-like n=1 Tax=Amphiura filiformis TaxID=82378 RepID=UPI003B228709